MGASRVHGTDVPILACEDIMSKHKSKGEYMLSPFAVVAGTVARRSCPEAVEGRNPEHIEESRD
jgi:hypothetical protein